VADSAFPATKLVSFHGLPAQEIKTEGLTKRELFAAMAMQGIVANQAWGWKPGWAAEVAVDCADKLLSLLEQPVSAEGQYQAHKEDPHGA